MQAVGTGYESDLAHPDRPVLILQNVSKRYGGVQALEDVSLQVWPGEVHAVLGENGAGKSTLVGVMGGFVRTDAGAVTDAEGRSVEGDPAAARSAGIRTVHQHFMLVPAFSVAENLALATMDGLRGTVDLVEEGRSSFDRARRLGWEVDPHARAGDLSVGARQRLELLKTLSGEAKLLILDEPTAVLSEREVDELLDLVRNLSADGVAVVLVAHKLSEVMAVADRITVLRHGRKVGSTLREQADVDRIAEWMVGETLTPPSRDQGSSGPVVLSVRDVRVSGDQGQESVQGVTFDVRSGEVFGIGGVDGNGQVELAEALAGIRTVRTGSVEGPDPRQIGYVPQDRQTDGLAANLSVMANTMVGALDLPEARRGPFLDLRAFRTRARSLMKEFDVRAASEESPVASLSGGNRQKVLLARVFSRKPRLLIVVNPTRGLDIRASAFVHAKILEAAKDGAAVVLVSTDTDELSALCTTTAFLGRGKLFGTLREATS